MLEREVKKALENICKKLRGEIHGCVVDESEYYEIEFIEVSTITEHPYRMNVSLTMPPFFLIEAVIIEDKPCLAYRLYVSKEERIRDKIQLNFHALLK